MQFVRAIIAISLLGASLSSLAEVPNGNGTLLPSEFIFSIDGSDLGIFPLAISDDGNFTLAYDLGEGTVILTPANPVAGRYSEPLFCFDFAATSNGAVTLRARDANGHLIIGNVPLGGSLTYILDNDEINYVAPASAQCFYRGQDSGHFGLFGKPPQVPDDGPDGRIFSDRFETDNRVGIEYLNLAQSQNPGEPLNYQIIITNNGTSHLSNVAFQELAPVDPTYFDATLTPAAWSCTATFAGLCPSGSEDPNTLRFSNLNLPVGASMTFNVVRNVGEESLAGTVIDLHAGVVAGAGSFAPFDVASKQVVVTGDPQGIVFFQQPSNVTAGNVMAPPVVIRVLDEQGNWVVADNSTTVQLRLFQDDQEINANLANATASNGEISFNNLVLNDPGSDYSLFAVAILPDFSPAVEMSSGFEVFPVAP